MILTAREAYRVWAATYDDAPNPVTWLLNRHLEEFAGDVRGKRVLDVGCGTGRWISRFGGVGLDISHEMLERCPRRAAQGDARALPFRDASADLVLCTLMLGYVWPVSEVMRELHRVVRVGGRVIAADLHPAGGWKRTFDDGGRTVEIENREYSLGQLNIAGLVLDESRNLFFGEPERQIYSNAGRPDLFDQVRETPVLWMRRWRK
jgi:SAM-dependent methyltransferase